MSGSALPPRGLPRQPLYDRCLAAHTGQMAERETSQQADARTRRAARALRVLAIVTLATAAGSLTGAVYFLSEDATVVSHVVWWVLIVMAVVLAVMAWGFRRAADELTDADDPGNTPPASSP